MVVKAWHLSAATILAIILVITVFLLIGWPLAAFPTAIFGIVAVRQFVYLVETGMAHDVVFPRTDRGEL
jgi:hypothetical protein